MTISINGIITKDIPKALNTKYFFEGICILLFFIKNFSKRKIIIEISIKAEYSKKLKISINRNTVPLNDKRLLVCINSSINVNLISIKKKTNANQPQMARKSKHLKRFIKPNI